ncbi:MAG: hypothetical protein LH478_03140 [Chitinophagaceae bacterium]|nr:hypothetical protein [Chitinophagaceae bacterium]
MHIDTYYKKFWAEALKKFKKGQFEYDRLIDDRNDHRYGLTILIRPSDVIKQAINQLLMHLKALEPDQYYYPCTDMHVTVLSVISCYNGFTRASFNRDDYTHVVKQSLKNIHPFKLHFQGITASPAGILAQGYPDGMLNLMRKNLRTFFKKSGLETSFDTRYAIVAAHSTIMRFKHPLNNPEKFIQVLKEYRHHEFGCMHVSEIELVFNDWYQRKEKGFTIATIELHEEHPK